MSLVVRCLFLALVWCAVIGGQARAEHGPDELELARQHDDRASELFGEGSYAAAVEEMLIAQVHAPSTIRLYNIAACFERINQVHRAIDYYQRFVDAPDAPARRVVVAQQRLDRLRASIAVMEQSTSPVVVDEPEQEPEPNFIDQGNAEVQEPLEPEGATSTPGGQETPEPPERSRRRLEPTPFYVIIGLAASAGIAMAAVGGVALSRNRTFEQMAEEDPTLTRNDSVVLEAHEDGRRLTITADVLLGVTCASAAAALILALFTSWQGDEAAGRVSFSPSAVTGGGSLGVSGRF